MSILSPIGSAIVPAMALVLSVTMHGQSSLGKQSIPGKLVGTVTDVNGDPVPNATVFLETLESNDRRTLVTPESGFFEFTDVKPDTPYHLNIRAKDFADWTSPTVTTDPGQFKLVTGIQLQIEAERTKVDVHYDPVEVANEQFKSEERQRVFGIIPNFYVSYESDPAPLTAKMKFKLALKVSTDPVTPGKPQILRNTAKAGGLMESDLALLPPMVSLTS
jgi:Carboxypeptidase regulatory-like domain